MSRGDAGGHPRRPSRARRPQPRHRASCTAARSTRRPVQGGYRAAGDAGLAAHLDPRPGRRAPRAREARRAARLARAAASPDDRLDRSCSAAQPGAVRRRPWLSRRQHGLSPAHGRRDDLLPGLAGRRLACRWATATRSRATARSAARGSRPRSTSSSRVELIKGKTLGQVWSEDSDVHATVSGSTTASTPRWQMATDGPGPLARRTITGSTIWRWRRF